MNIPKFKSSYLSIAYKILSEPREEWSTRDFVGYRRNDIVGFIKLLVKNGVMKRTAAFGSLSKTTLVKPKELLSLCVGAFKDNNIKSVYCISKGPLDEVLKKIKENPKDIILGNLSGVRKGLHYATHSVLTLQVSERKYLRNNDLKDLEYRLGMGVVRSPKSGTWNIEILLPRHWRFLKQTADKEDSLFIPSDFYTYLSLAASNNSLHQEQAEYIYNTLKRKPAGFLSWVK
jgi:hypothetical protein